MRRINQQKFAKLEGTDSDRLVFALSIDFTREIRKITMSLYLIQLIGAGYG